MSVNQIAGIVIQEGRQRLGKKVSEVHMPLEVGEVYTPDFRFDCRRASRKIKYAQKRKVPLGVSELFDDALKAKAP